MEIVRIPFRAVATLIGSSLLKNGVKFEIVWKEHQAYICVNKSDVNLLQGVENRFIKQRYITQTFSLHCSYIPLFREEFTLNLLNQLEKNYNVKITFTESFINPINIAHALKYYGQVFSRQQISSILIPRDTTSKLPVWYCCADSSFQQVHKLSACDSVQMEEMLQYGGISITLLGEDYMVDFKEMIMRSSSGRTLHLHRKPALDEILHTQLLTNIHVQNLLSDVEGMHQDCLILLRKMLIRKERINWSCPFKFTLDMQQQLENFVKQFCVFFEFTAIDQSVTLEGAPGYVELVQELVKQRVCHLEAYFSSLETANMSPIQWPQQLICFDPPPFWVPQVEKCIFCEVNQGSPEWNFVLAQARASMSNVSLHSVERIQNIVLWERYSLEEKHMQIRNHGETNEKFLFHGTSQTDPYMIAKSDFGVDFRFSKWNRSTLMWGTGAYFADRLRYSDAYAFKLLGGRKVVMLVSVLTGKSCNFGTVQKVNLTKPPFYDSTTGVREYDTVSGKIHDTTVYTVYDHCKACPAYIITY